MIIMTKGFSFAEKEGYESFTLEGEDETIECSKERAAEFRNRRALEMEKILVCVMAGRIAQVSTSFNKTRQFVPFLAILSHLPPEERSFVYIGEEIDKSRLLQLSPSSEEDWSLFRENFFPDGTSIDKTVKLCDFINKFRKYKGLANVES